MNASTSKPTTARADAIFFGLLILAQLWWRKDNIELGNSNCLVLVLSWLALWSFNTYIFPSLKDRKFVCPRLTYYLAGLGVLIAVSSILTLTEYLFSWMLGWNPEVLNPPHAGAKWMGLGYVYLEINSKILSLFRPLPPAPKLQRDFAAPGMKSRVVTDPWWAKYH